MSIVSDRWEPLALWIEDEVDAYTGLAMAFELGVDMFGLLEG